MNTEEHRPLPTRSMLTLLVSLAAAWLLWSGIYKPLLLILGAASCLVTFWLVWRMRYFDEKLFALRFSVRLVGYWWWLGIEVMRSSIMVARIILDPKMPISPRVVEIKSKSPHPFEQVILGNSITLTPGTLSMDVYKGSILVHSLTEDAAHDLEAGEMNRRVSDIRGNE